MGQEPSAGLALCLLAGARCSVGPGPHGWRESTPTPPSTHTLSQFTLLSAGCWEAPRHSVKPWGPLWEWRQGPSNCPGSTLPAGTPRASRLPGGHVREREREICHHPCDCDLGEMCLCLCGRCCSSSSCVRQKDGTDRCSLPPVRLRRAL